MIYISPNYGHAFFGLAVLILAFVALYDITSSKKTRRLALDRAWGPVMACTGLIYLAALTVSLSFADMTNIAISQGQHTMLAVVIIMTSLACLSQRLLYVARLTQLAGFAFILFFHTHTHTGPSWEMSYHRLLALFALTLAGLFIVMRSTRQRSLIYIIGGMLFLASAALILYTESAHVHTTTVPAASVTQAASCTGTTVTHTVTFNTTQGTLAAESAQLCDEILIVNNTDSSIDVEAGEHPAHIDYPLVSGATVAAHSSTSIRLTAIGELKIHDHTTGTFASPVLTIR